MIAFVSAVLEALFWFVVATVGVAFVVAVIWGQYIELDARYRERISERERGGRPPRRCEQHRSAPLPARRQAEPARMRRSAA